MVEKGDEVEMAASRLIRSWATVKEAAHEMMITMNSGGMMSCDIFTILLAQY